MIRKMSDEKKETDSPLNYFFPTVYQTENPSTVSRCLAFYRECVGGDMPRPERFINNIRKKHMKKGGKAGLPGGIIAMQEGKTIYSQIGLEDCI